MTGFHCPLTRGRESSSPEPREEVLHRHSERWLSLPLSVGQLVHRTLGGGGGGRGRREREGEEGGGGAREEGGRR